MTIPSLDNINMDSESDIETMNELYSGFWNLAEYARLTSLAMQDRAIGKINEALRREREAEEIYRNVPPNWRW